VSWPIQDHADALLDLLRADADLTVYDGLVPKTPASRYVLVYLLVQTPGGLEAPDKVRLDNNSEVIDLWAYCHCVGGGQNAASNARAVSGRVRAALLNVKPSLPGRVVFPIRWRESSPPQRNEDLLSPVVDLVDVYGWVTKPT
jgi:hypothetical protein